MDEAVLRIILQDATSATSGVAGTTSTRPPSAGTSITAGYAGIDIGRRFAESTAKIGESFTKSLAPVIDILTDLRDAQATAQAINKDQQRVFQAIAESARRSTYGDPLGGGGAALGLLSAIQSSIKQLADFTIASQSPTATQLEISRLQLELHEQRKQLARVTFEQAPPPVTEVEKLRAIEEEIFKTTLRHVGQPATVGEEAQRAASQEAIDRPLPSKEDQRVEELQALIHNLGELLPKSSSGRSWFSIIAEAASTLAGYAVVPVARVAEAVKTSTGKIVDAAGNAIAAIDKVLTGRMFDEAAHIAKIRGSITEAEQQLVEAVGQQIAAKPEPVEGPQPPMAGVGPEPPLVMPVQEPAPGIHGPPEPQVAMLPTTPLDEDERIRNELLRLEKLRQEGLSEEAAQLEETEILRSLKRPKMGRTRKKKAKQVGATIPSLTGPQSEPMQPLEGTPAFDADALTSPVAPEDQETPAFDIGTPTSSVVPVDLSSAAFDTNAPSPVSAPADLGGAAFAIEGIPAPETSASVATDNASNDLVASGKETVELLKKKVQLEEDLNALVRDISVAVGKLSSGTVIQSASGGASSAAPVAGPALTKQEEEQELRRLSAAARDKEETARRRKQEELAQVIAEQKKGQEELAQVEETPTPTTGLPEDYAPSFELAEGEEPVKEGEFDLFVDEQESIPTPAIDALEGVAEDALSIEALRKEQEEEEQIAAASASVAADMLAEEMREKKERELAERKKRAKRLRESPEETEKRLYEEALSRQFPVTSGKPILPPVTESPPETPEQVASRQAAEAEEEEIGKLLLEGAGSVDMGEAESATIPLAPEATPLVVSPDDNALLWAAWRRNPKRRLGKRRQIGYASFQKMLAAGMPEDTGKASTRGRRTISSEEYEAYAAILEKQGLPPPDFFAQGGWVGRHPGSAQGTDTIPAWLTEGEYVVPADVAAANRPQLEAMHKAEGGEVPPQGGAKGKGRLPGTVGALGSAASWAASGPDPSAPISAMGNAASAAGMQLAATVPVIGTFIAVAGETTKALGGMMSAVNTVADRYGEFSPQIAGAQAQAEIVQTLGDIQRSQEISAEMAQYIAAQSDLQQKFENTKVELLKKMLPALTDMVELAKDALDGIRVIAKFGGTTIDRLVDMITSAETQAEMAREMLERERRRDLAAAVNDPTEALFRSDTGLGSLYRDAGGGPSPMGPEGLRE